MSQLVSQKARSISRRIRILVMTALGLGAVLGLGLWDIQHEDQAALHRLMQEEHLLADTIARQAHPTARNLELGAMFWLEANRSAARGSTSSANHEDGFIVLLADAARNRYLASENRSFEIVELKQAQSRGEPGAILSRDTAAILGLPRRTAVAGLAPLEDHTHKFNAVVVVTSAEAERDRSRREQWRSALEIVLASALVLWAGIGALRQQKQALDLERQRELYQLERARDAELARANRMATIAALSSGIAHEISTPLAVISGKIEHLLSQFQGQDRTARSLETISAQAHRIDQIMRGFLAFAKGETPMLVDKPANEIAQAAIRLVQFRFAGAHVQLEFTPCSDSNLAVACDPALFEQALIDILINALEASRANQTVSLSVERAVDGVCFTVLDEGAGISEAVVTHVTDPFFTTKSSKGGSGLGLAIAKEIVAHHRGALTFELRRNAADAAQPGTRVTITLPLTKEIPIESVERN